MRNWEGKRSRPSSRQRALSSSDSPAPTDGPELLLTPLTTSDIYLTNKNSLCNSNNKRDDTSSTNCRNSSRGRNSNARVSPVVTQYSIPVDDILIVHTGTAVTTTTTTISPNKRSSRRGGCQQQHHRLSLTTLSLGCFEFDGLSSNGHDILLTFLQACLHPERIVHDDDAKDTHPLKSGSSSVTSCLDIDTLQARCLKGRAEAETWPERLSRRVGHVFNNLSELSSSFCDVACCREAAAETREAAPPPVQHPAYHSHHRLLFAELEIDDATTIDGSPRTIPPPQQHPPKHSHDHPKKVPLPPLQVKMISLPSGLSVEPELESVR